MCKYISSLLIPLNVQLSQAKLVLNLFWESFDSVKTIEEYPCSWRATCYVKSLIILGCNLADNDTLKFLLDSGSIFL